MRATAWSRSNSWRAYGTWPRSMRSRLPDVQVVDHVAVPRMRRADRYRRPRDGAHASRPTLAEVFRRVVRAAVYRAVSGPRHAVRRRLGALPRGVRPPPRLRGDASAASLGAVAGAVLAGARYRRRAPRPAHAADAVRHGLRSLINAGDPEGLAQLGNDADARDSRANQRDAASRGHRRCRDARVRAARRRRLRAGRGRLPGPSRRRARRARRQGVQASHTHATAGPGGGDSPPSRVPGGHRAPPVPGLHRSVVQVRQSAGRHRRRTRQALVHAGPKARRRTERAAAGWRAGAGRERVCLC